MHVECVTASDAHSWCVLQDWQLATNAYFIIVDLALANPNIGRFVKCCNSLPMLVYINHKYAVLITGLISNIGLLCLPKLVSIFFAFLDISRKSPVKYGIGEFLFNVDLLSNNGYFQPIFRMNVRFTAITGVPCRHFQFFFHCNWAIN